LGETPEGLKRFIASLLQAPDPNLVPVSAARLLGNTELAEDHVFVGPCSILEVFGYSPDPRNTALGTRHARHDTTTRGRRPFEVAATVLCFLSGFAIPGGIYLIIAGISGKQADLPSNWREHISVAGIVVIGLSVQYVFGRMKDSLAHLAGHAPEGTSPPDSRTDREGAS
jgi:hypothetical protein